MRRFGTTDLVIVMVLWGAMAVVIGGVLAELVSDTDAPLAKAQAEAYALQLAEAHAAELRDTTRSGVGLRGPASVVTVSASGRDAVQMGTLGRDPWGNPYGYIVTAKGVVVWSHGKNGVAESKDVLGRFEMGQVVGSFRFSGDDLGFLKFNTESRL
ncbi:MAG: hypothetical protein RBT63_03380 [Bdellovibrionales bacterium]|nr:hypothetical protein [Bdellovibrionales bacterium]